MLGEIGWKEHYVKLLIKHDQPILTATTCLLIPIFILVVPILMINLLIGIAVGDIAEARSKAKIRYTKSLVSFLMILDKHCTPSSQSNNKLIVFKLSMG